MFTNLLRRFIKGAHNKPFQVQGQQVLVLFKFKFKSLHTSKSMANTKYDYVKSFELDDKLLPNCWIVARVDGRGFHKLAKTHDWKRPNDVRALNLMNHAAKMVMQEYDEIILSYGQSDEYSFVFRKETKIFERRSSKLISTIVSKFTSSFIYKWSTYFPTDELQYPPSFDCRIVLYPTVENLRDYLSWRQADCHINNLYNTAFWSLVQLGGLTNSEAEKKLCGSVSADKNELLFSQFGINYSHEPEMFRKGTVLVSPEPSMRPKTKRLSRKEYLEKKKNRDTENNKELAALKELENLDVNSKDDDKDNNFVAELTCDIIQDKFWNDFPYLLNYSNKKVVQQ